MHWMSDSAGTVIGYYKFDGSSWVVQKIDAQSLNVSSLSALSADLGKITAGDINGVNISSSKFTVAYSHANLDGDGNKTSGTMTISDGQASIAGNVESTAGVDSGQKYTTLLSPSGVANTVTEPDGVTKLNSVYLSMGTLNLSSLISGTGSTAKYAQGSLNGFALQQLSNFIGSWIPLVGLNGFVSNAFYKRAGGFYFLKGYFVIPANYQNTKVAFKLPGKPMPGQYSASIAVDSSAIVNQVTGYIFSDTAGNMSFYSSSTFRKIMSVNGVVLTEDGYDGI